MDRAPDKGTITPRFPVHSGPRKAVHGRHWQCPSQPDGWQAPPEVPATVTLASQRGRGLRRSVSRPVPSRVGRPRWAHLGGRSPGRCLRSAGPPSATGAGAALPVSPEAEPTRHALESCRLFLHSFVLRLPPHRMTEIAAKFLRH